MQDLDLDTGASETPIVPIMWGKSRGTKDLADFVWKKGIFVLPIFYPMVAREKTRIRTQLCAMHTQEHLDRAIAAFEEGDKNLALSELTLSSSLARLFYFREISD